MIFFGPSNQNYIDTLTLTRGAIEATYDCLCDVIEYKAKKDPITKRTSHKEETILKGKPCRISFKTINNTSETEIESNVTQAIKLFVAEDSGCP